MTSIPTRRPGKTLTDKLRPWIRECPGRFTGRFQYPNSPSPTGSLKILSSMKPTDPLELLRTWIAAVNARDAEKVMSLYHEDAVLIPTFSPEIRRGLERIQDYFTHVYTNDRVTVELIEDTITVQDLGDGWLCSAVSTIG